jgi:thiamine biosynthesis protein ThiS
MKPGTAYCEVKTMKVYVNKCAVDLPNELTIHELLKRQGYDPSGRVAVWVNGKQLLRKEYENRTIAAGDCITVIRSIAGG